MKPYPAYKDSGTPWIGEIPTHWDLAPAFALLQENKVSNRGLQNTNLLSLSYGRIITRDVDAGGLLPASFETYQIVEPGNIIMRLTDLQNDQKSLRVGLSRHSGIITSAYLCLRTKGNLSPGYAYYVLHALDTMKVLYTMGGGLRQTMDFVDLRRMPVLLPRPEEQAAIVAYLDRKNADIDRFITKKRQLIALLNEQKAAIINQAVTRGLDPKVPMKASGVEWLGDIPAHWTLTTVGRAMRLGRGRVISHEEIGENPGSYPVYSSQTANDVKPRRELSHVTA